MKFIFLQLILLSCCASKAIEYDKYQHFYYSGILSSVSYGGLRAANYSKVESALISFTFAYTIGYIKESTDRVFDEHDMHFNAIGSGVGVMLSISLDF